MLHAKVVEEERCQGLMYVSMYLRLGHEGDLLTGTKRNGKGSTYSLQLHLCCSNVRLDGILLLKKCLSNVHRALRGGCCVCHGVCVRDASVCGREEKYHFYVRFYFLLSTALVVFGGVFFCFLLAG